ARQPLTTASQAVNSRVARGTPVCRPCPKRKNVRETRRPLTSKPKQTTPNADPPNSERGPQQSPAAPAANTKLTSSRVGIPPSDLPPTLHRTFQTADAPASTSLPAVGPIFSCRFSFQLRQAAPHSCQALLCLPNLIQ